jgi:hypothetical protein
MPHIEYFIVSESISIDQVRNTVSLFHVFEELSFRKFPGRIPFLVISTLWDIEESERGKDYEGEIRLTPPNSEEPQAFPFNFTTDRIAPRQRVLLELKNVSVPEVGMFKFQVYLEGNRHAGHTIHIRQTESPASESSDHIQDK